jgi:hypothetical protein
MAWQKCRPQPRQKNVEVAVYRVESVLQSVQQKVYTREMMVEDAEERAYSKLGMVVHACNPSTQKVKAGGS